MKTNTIIIAEAGVNHNGDLELAKKMVEVAADAGADYIKFQTFKAENLVTKSAAKANYQLKNTDALDQSQMSMLKRLELSEEMHPILIEYCQTRNIKFLSTAFDLESIDYLNRFNLDFFKVPSGEITNKPLLEKIGSLGKKIILSTGMSSMEEIQDALNILLEAGAIKSSITVLHCNTEYPTPMKDVNLRAMQTIADKFNVNVGYSDHTEGIDVSLAAVALGAQIIEKHFTLDKEMDGPDHKASLDPSELKTLVRSIRNLELALGSNEKKLTPSEAKNVNAVRKSVHLKNHVDKGHIFSLEDLIMKRPGDGISPMKYDAIIGRPAAKELSTDHKLRWEDLA